MSSVIQRSALFLAFAAALPVFVTAQQVTLQSIIVSFTAALAPIVGVLVAIALVVFLWGLVLFIARSDEDAAREDGKKRMLWGVVALFVIVAVWGIVSLLGILLGIDSGRTGCNAPQILADGTVSGCQ